MNLDGETNLKLKQALEVTNELHNDEIFRSLRLLSNVRIQTQACTLLLEVLNMKIKTILYHLSRLFLETQNSATRSIFMA